MESKRWLSDLIKLYDHYGFSYMSGISSRGVPVFERTLAGRFLADIVSPGGQSSTVRRLQQDLNQSEYSCRVRETPDSASLDTQLFTEFFGLRATRNRIKTNYGVFKQKQADQSAGLAYTYKPIRFVTPEDPSSPRENLISEICNIIASKGPRLIIVEAAAGFGKTCTAYEVAHEIANLEAQPILPLFSELSRNRAAREFRYILLDELNRNFPAVNDELAYYQIHQGRLPVILDGFDELLHRPGLKRPTLVDAEPMLETIRSLLKFDACVLITTRNSTLLSGDEFQEWLDNYYGDFGVYRFLLEKPDAKTWIAGDKRQFLAEVQFPLQQLANPVLFAFIDSLSPESIHDSLQTPEELVSDYMNRMLVREKERQSLLMEPHEQKLIFTSIAEAMIDQDFKAETRDFFSDYIRQRFESLLAEVLPRYEKDSKSITELIDILLRHVWFDRRLESRGLLGFQNEFVLGTLVGEIIQKGADEWVGPEDFLAMAITAFSIRGDGSRALLWDKASFMAEFIDSNSNLLLDFDVLLTGKIQRKLEGRTFSEMNLRKVGFGETHLLSDCCFVNTNFHRCRFNTRLLSSVSFINCSFQDCLYDQSSREDGSIQFFDCVSRPASFLEQFGGAATRRSDLRQADAEHEEHLPFERKVLENFWPPGRPNFGGRRALRTLYMGAGPGDHRRVTKAIRWLSQEGLIILDSDHADLNRERLNDIMYLLGRD